MNNADLIVATLKANGIARGFGIPSGNVLPLMEAMRKGGVEFVLTAHEGSAGFAADVTGRMTGAPGLCIATLGPGATNLATGVGSAFLDRSPMIAITCNLNTDQLGRRIQMWIDHHALFKPITKATLPLKRGCIAETLTEAIRLAAERAEGAGASRSAGGRGARAHQRAGSPRRRNRRKLAAAPDAALARAGEVIAAAKRPIAVLGSSAMRVGDPQLLRNVIERHNLPFATTTMAKGMIDEDHPLALGCIERACRQIQRRSCAPPTSSSGSATTRSRWNTKPGSATGRCCRSTSSRSDVAPSVKLVHQVIGDLDRVARARLPHCRPPPTCGTGRRWPSIVADFMRRCALRPGPFTAHAAIDAVRRALPRDGLLSFDVGAHTHQIASQWTAHAPKSFHITNGWSSMGFGLPGAIAAKLARPDLPVVCLLGDGCFQMTCGEVATAKRLGHHASGRRARRPLARAHQGQADPAPVPALRHRAAERKTTASRRRIISACPRWLPTAPRRSRRPSRRRWRPTDRP